MPAPDEKKTECIKVWVALPLAMELRRLAENDDRKTSDYIGLILSRHVYGHAARVADDSDGPNRAE